MRTAILILSFSACAGHANKIHAKKACNELQALATYLMTFNPADAFNPSLANTPSRTVTALTGSGHRREINNHISHQVRPSQHVKMMDWMDSWKHEPTQEGHGKTAEVPKGPEPISGCITKEALKLKAIGGSPFDKALQVNLDANIYGSFAEIGAGQEVSRTFLQAGAAAGTVAKSISAYDMQMSDAVYGTSKRYVTKERLLQMMGGEYRDLEVHVRENKAARTPKGPEVRFFSFAATLAAKAFMSDRECEGWVGVQYQHEAGAKTSTVTMHVRMSDPTAPLQGEAIGVLGTNLVYLITNTNDPYMIASFLQDGIAKGRLEIDYLDFEGPGFPETSFDPRILALQMVQNQLTPCVLLELDAESGKYRQAVPNDAFYKTPVIVQRSRFTPVTYAHQELMEAASRQVVACSSEGDRAPKSVFNVQIDDLLPPAKLSDPLARIRHMQSLLEADVDRDGFLSLDDLRRLLAGLSPEEVDELLLGLDPDGTGFVEIDGLTDISGNSRAVMAFLYRMDMLETLKHPILVSAIERNHNLVDYLARYTAMQATIVVGGDHSFMQGLYNSESYADLDGGLLEAIGRLFSKNVKILQYPNIEEDGTASATANPDGSAGHLHQYLLKEGSIVPISEKYMTATALDNSLNKMPPAVADIVKNRQNVAKARESAGVVFRFLENIFS